MSKEHEHLPAILANRLVVLLLAAVAIVVGCLLFFDVVRTDDMMYYISPERQKFRWNEATIKELRETVQELKERIKELEKNQQTEVANLTKQLESANAKIASLREENRQLKWKGIFGFHTILDKFLGLLIVLLGVCTAYLALSAKRAELKKSEEKSDEDKKIIIPL